MCVGVIKSGGIELGGCGFAAFGGNRSFGCLYRVAGVVVSGGSGCGFYQNSKVQNDGSKMATVFCVKSIVPGRYFELRNSYGEFIFSDPVKPRVEFVKLVRAIYDHLF